MNQDPAHPRYLPTLVDYPESKELQLEAEDYHHLVRVLKLRTGDVVEVIHPGQWQAEAKVKRLAKREIFLALGERLNIEPRGNDELCILLAHPRPNVLADLIEPLNELGVARLQIVLTSKSKMKEKKEVNVHKYRKKVLESLKQCGSQHVLEIPEVLLFDELTSWTEGEVMDQRFFANEWREGQDTSAFTAKGKTCVAIGPEGGWTPVEIERLRELGYKDLDFGPLVLKTFTATLYAAANWQRGHLP